METVSALLAICAGNSSVLCEFPTQWPVTRSFDVFVDLRPNNRWVNNGEAGDLRRYRTHCDVIVMKTCQGPYPALKSGNIDLVMFNSPRPGDAYTYTSVKLVIIDSGNGCRLFRDQPWLTVS